MMSPARAEQRTRFFDTYRSYVINYNLGKDLVKQFVESREGVSTSQARRWEEFVKLLASPRLPSGLQHDHVARSASSRSSATSCLRLSVMLRATMP